MLYITAKGLKDKFRPLLKALDALLKLALSPLPQCICYYSQFGYSDNAYYQYKHILQTRNGFTHIWLVDSPLQKSRILSDYARVSKQGGDNRLKVYYKKSLIGYFAYIRSKTVFHTHGLYRFATTGRNRTSWSLWHGMPIKAIGALAQVTAGPEIVANKLIASSDFFRYIIASAFKAHADDILVTTQPRCDVLKNSDLCDYDATAIKLALNINKQQPYILWLPTFRTEPLGQSFPNKDVRSFLDDMSPNALIIMNDLARRRGIHIIIKLHPCDRLNQKNTPPHASNISFLTSTTWEKFNIPLYDLVSHSEMLLSDVSSVIIDYLLTNRKIGIISFDPKQYKRGVLFNTKTLLSCRNIHQIKGVSDFEAFLNFPVISECRYADFFNAPTDELGAESILKHCASINNQ